MQNDPNMVVYVTRLCLTSRKIMATTSNLYNIKYLALYFLKSISFKMSTRDGQSGVGKM